MENIKELITKSLKKAVKELTGLEVAPILEYPLDEKHGDYSSNIAMVLFKDKGLMIKDKEYRTPLELARLIAEKLNNSSLIINHCSLVEAVSPGFINFWLSKDYLTTLMIYIIRAKDKYGSSHRLLNKKIMVEFTDPNPFKEFHIGHLYSNIVGESISRLLESQGASVKRANYQGDVGMHVAKALYALLSSKFKVQSSKLDKESLIDKIKILGDAYAFGTKAYEEDESAKKEIEKINKQIYEKDPAIMPVYERGRKWSLEYFETIYRRLGTKFDYYYFESETAERGLKLVRQYLKKGVFQESNGAIIFPGEKYGLHKRVFVNSQGMPTYEAKDLGLAQTKYKDFPYDLSIIITAQEQSSYFKVVIKAISLIDPKLSQKTRHIAHGVVRLPTGKMSSRTGNVITGEWLLDEAKDRIQRAYPEMDKPTAEKVAIGAVKYALLKSGVGRDIAFSFDESISLEGNSGPYLQYTFARTQSVLNKVKSQSFDKAQDKKSKVKNKSSLAGSHLAKLEVEEESILRAIHRFPEVVEEAAEKFSPNLLCNYLFDLAQKFNLFYQRVPILKIRSKVRPYKAARFHLAQEFRLALTVAVGQIIKNGLYLLGIAAPERM